MSSIMLGIIWLEILEHEQKRGHGVCPWGHIDSWLGVEASLVQVCIIFAVEECVFLFGVYQFGSLIL